MDLPVWYSALALSAPEVVGAVKALPDARVGQSYEYCIALRGFTEPISYRWTGQLPEGLSAGGPRLSGTPQNATPEPVPLTLEITDALGASVRQGYTLFVRPALLPLRIVTNSPPVFVVGEQVEHEIVAVGGEGAYAWQVLATSMPRGLEVRLNESKGRCLVSGTPVEPGELRINVSVTDQSRQRDGPVWITGRVAPAVAPPLEIVTAALPPASYAMPYHATLVAVGGKPPYRWAAAALDDVSAKWLTCSSSGILTGVPPRIESASLGIKVTDALGSSAVRSGVELRVEPPVERGKFELRPAELPPAVVGRPFSAEIIALHARGVVSWNISNVPPWLQIEKVGASLRLRGRADRPGGWSFTVCAQDLDQTSSAELARPFLFASAGPHAYLLQAVEQKLKADPVRVQTESLPVAVVGIPYRVQLAARGGEGAITFTGETARTSWVRLESSGVLSGTPTQPGEVELSVQARDSVGNFSQTRKLVIRVVAAANQNLRVLPFEPPVVLQGREFTFQMPIVGGLLPYEAQLEPGPPPGLHFDSRECRLSGKPGRCGRFPLALRVRDATPGGAPIYHQFTLEVVPERTVVLPPWPLITIGAAGVLLAALGMFLLFKSIRTSTTADSLHPPM